MVIINYSTGCCQASITRTSSSSSSSSSFARNDNKSKPSSSYTILNHDRTRRRKSSAAAINSSGNGNKVTTTTKNKNKNDKPNTQSYEHAYNDGDDDDDGEILSMEELSKSFVEVKIPSSQSVPIEENEVSKVSKKTMQSTIFTRTTKNIKNITSTIARPHWIIFISIAFAMKYFRDERDLKLVKEMLNIDDVRELPENEQRIEIERARLKWKLKALQKDKNKLNNYREIENMITEKLDVLNRIKMKQAEAEVKRAEWLERVGDEAGSKKAVKEAERIVEVKAGTIDISAKRMKTPHPGANLKWLKPEDYVERLQKSFLEDSKVESSSSSNNNNNMTKEEELKEVEEKKEKKKNDDDVFIPTLLADENNNNNKNDMDDGNSNNNNNNNNNTISEAEIREVERELERATTTANGEKDKFFKSKEGEEGMPAELEDALRNMDADFMSMKFSEDELFEKYGEILDKYGLNVPKEGQNNEFGEMKFNDDESDDDEKNVHPQLRDPYYYKSLRAVHVIFVNKPNQKYDEFLCMQMVPEEIPEKERPSEKYHVVSFESIADAERFCFLTRAQRESNEDPVYTTRPFSVKNLEDEAKEVNRGVTVVGANRIDFTPGRSPTLVLNEIMCIGNEVYLWEFAKQCKRTFDKKEEQMKKPAPPTIDGAY